MNAWYRAPQASPKPVRGGGLTYNVFYLAQGT